MEISPTPPCPQHELAVNLLPDWSGLVGYVLSRPAASRTLPADHAAVLGAARPRPLRSRWSQPLGSPSVLFRAGGSMPNTVTVATQAVRNGWAVSSAGAQSELCPQRPGGLLDCRRGKEETPQSRGAETASWSSGAPLKAVTLLMGHRFPQPHPQGPRHLPPPSDHTLCSGAVGPLEHPRGAPTNPVFQGRTSRLREVERLAQGHALRRWAAGSHASPARLGSPAAAAARPGPGRPSQAPPVAVSSSAGRSCCPSGSAPPFPDEQEPGSPSLVLGHETQVGLSPGHPGHPG